MCNPISMPVILSHGDAFIKLDGPPSTSGDAPSGEVATEMFEGGDFRASSAAPFFMEDHSMNAFQHDSSLIPLSVIPNNPEQGWLHAAMPANATEEAHCSTSCSLPTRAAAATTPSHVKTAVKRRRRKPQKPGKTAKNQERHFVVHNYHDYADEMEDKDDVQQAKKSRGATPPSTFFPTKLHAFLEQVEVDGYKPIVSWQEHGRCFVIHKPKDFVSIVMPRYFKQSKLTSFQRQLNIYGFNRLTRGPDEGGYYNEHFLRGKAFLCKRMTRTKVKGTRFKAASNPDNEPNFYAMKPAHAASLFSRRQAAVLPQEHATASAGDAAANSTADIPMPANVMLPTATHAGHESQETYQTRRKPMNPSEFLSIPPCQALSSQINTLLRVPSETCIASLLPKELSNISSISLDEVVEELFLSENDATDDETITDFVSSWDPTPCVKMSDSDETEFTNLLEEFAMEAIAV